MSEVLRTKNYQYTQHYGRRFLILTSELIESELHVHVACGVHVRLLEPSRALLSLLGPS